MPAICAFCSESDRPGRTKKFDRRLKLWIWIPCPRCKGTRQEIPVALYDPKAKAS